MCKYVNVLTLFIAVAFLALTASVASGGGICGDSNADGAVNISDAVYLIAYIFAGGPAPDCPSVYDIDGNGYHSVTIGTQVWMAENLKVTHYRNGDAIPNVTDGATWGGLTTGAYCEYDNNVASVATYGRLYNWFAAVDSRNIAPVGWHVPSDDEWKQLEMHLGMSQAEADAEGLRGVDEGGKLKEIGTTHWDSPNTGATNESGFSALPGGFRRETGVYVSKGFYADFWTTTEGGVDPWFRLLHANSAGITRFTINFEQYGFSVRCVKD